jgi:hypothetical protein
MCRQTDAPYDIVNYILFHYWKEPWFTSTYQNKIKYVQVFFIDYEK